MKNEIEIIGFKSAPLNGKWVVSSSNVFNHGLCVSFSLVRPVQSKSRTPRQRYLEWKARRIQTPNMRRYGTIQTAKLFAALSADLGISVDAARCRYYRKQIKPATLRKARQAIGRQTDDKDAANGIVGAGKAII